MYIAAETAAVREPFDADGAVVLASHEHESADDEDAGHARQRVYGGMPMRRVPSDRIDVLRQGNEDQPGKDRRSASDHDKKVVPLIRSICVERQHPSPRVSPNTHNARSGGVVPRDNQAGDDTLASTMPAPQRLWPQAVIATPP